MHACNQHPHHPRREFERGDCLVNLHQTHGAKACMHTHRSESAKTLLRVKVGKVRIFMYGCRHVIGSYCVCSGLRCQICNGVWRNMYGGVVLYVRGCGAFTCLSSDQMFAIMTVLQLAPSESLSKLVNLELASGWRGRWNGGHL